MSDHRPHNEIELIEVLRSIDERAPAQVHDRVAALVADASRQRLAHLWRPRRLDWRLGSVAAAVAALALALVLVLTGPGHDGLTLREASALTLEPSTMPAPSEDAKRHAQLDAAVEGVSFPYWKERFGWHAAGAREDRLAGRAVKTVFYVDARGKRLGYAIVAGTPAPRIGAGVAHWQDGTAYWLSSQHGAKVVTWRRDGRLCVMSGRGVGASILLRLASWDDQDDIA